MKTLFLIPVAAMSLYTMQVYAADNTSTSSTDSTSAPAMTKDATGGTMAGTTGSGAGVSKTRAQVYQELTRAKQDGTLDRINAFYGGN